MARYVVEFELRAMRFDRMPVIRWMSFEAEDREGAKERAKEIGKGHRARVKKVTGASEADPGKMGVMRERRKDLF
jgi:hypothetical protein